MNRSAISLFMLGVLVGSPLTVTALGPAIQSARTNRGQNVVLKLAHVLPASHPVHTSLEFMARRVSKLSAGAVELQVFGGGQLGSEPESIEKTQRGELALVKISAAALEGYVPDMAVFGMPYLFRDEQHYWNVLLGDIGKEILRTAESQGLHGLGYYDSGSRSFYTLSKPVLTPIDVRGMKLRVQPSRQAPQMITILGGSPTPIALW